ncbi:uncharacterized protein F4822DRAFT_243737 [Hypoxylon trugodes]|uniref:uncharacterized protein n=1 Tax=Hypoxylon trugodes TaxID=326681 RepID=UPI002197C9B3|nr:uncharacterized protein F4822DRAFT_243737 [Hypoxylon trugodes]KAI1388364.1 hypothetical protein F4822DRAFT_243737 [Hypoxylon trugodes]
MPPLDIDSQFRFLIVCIKHSTAGKVDFQEVANECDIVSKGAAAKRYERLMKAHGITPSGGLSGLKKEPKDSKDGVKTRTPNKKRKLATVEENAGDIDEPIKTEVKGEVKTEDSIAVKVEQENVSGATAAVLATGPGLMDQPTTSSSTNAQNDDDDEVFVVSATERRDDRNTLAYGSSGHHHSHSHSHSHSPAPMIPGIHSIDYTANLGFPQQMPLTAPSTRMPTSHDTLPYGFPAATWMYPHDTHGYL